jgi:uncharacterized integral membrane protein (TIGR00697 family)
MTMMPAMPMNRSIRAGAFLGEAARIARDGRRLARARREGKRRVRRCPQALARAAFVPIGSADELVQFGFIPLIASILLSLLVLVLPAANDMQPERLDAFNLMLWATPRIWLGGIIAYGVSQTLNVLIFAKLKREGGKLLWLRGAIAGVLSQIVDTLIFITVSFYGVFPIADLLLGQLLAKVVLSIVLVPPLIYALVSLGRRLDRG